MLGSAWADLNALHAGPSICPCGCELGRFTLGG